jgi:hypothetical protein
MYAAQVDDTGTVVQVIVGTADWALSRLGGVWLDSDTLVGIGWHQHDGGFRPPSPYPSWAWQDGTWSAPVPQPDGDGWYVWDEGTLGWQVVDGTITPPEPDELEDTPGDDI